MERHETLLALSVQLRKGLNVELMADNKTSCAGDRDMEENPTSCSIRGAVPLACPMDEGPTIEAV